jgi:hypothetical protein
MIYLVWLAAIVGKFARNAAGAASIAGVEVLQNYRNLGINPPYDLAGMLSVDPSELLRRIALEFEFGRLLRCS